jgi:hypothetical protein
MTADFRRWLVPSAMAPLVLLAACGGSSDGESGNANAACDSTVKPPADPAAKPPSDIPSPSGVTWYEVETAGATKAYFGYVSGDTVAVTRDEIRSQLESAGYEIEGTDEEDNAEAEAEFKGAHDGSLQVIPLCQNTLRVRYRLES